MRDGAGRDLLLIGPDRATPMCTDLPMIGQGEVALAQA
jgi:hypothetical protein